MRNALVTKVSWGPAVSYGFDVLKFSSSWGVEKDLTVYQMHLETTTFSRYRVV